MQALSYDEVDKLTPCAKCGSCRFWFDGEVWQCWTCRPPLSAGVIRVDIEQPPEPPAVLPGA